MSALGPLGVYVHWPYCARICPYCDFNVRKNRNVDEAQWRAALIRELEYWAEKTKGRTLTSLYFGGGTPSLAPLGVINAVIDQCANLWGLESNAEITLEANPTDAEQSRFGEFAAAGVNRLSLGVQSLRDDALKFLGREHSAEEARRAIEIAQAAFARVSLDLIYARPEQSLEDWKDELSEALKFGTGHLSLYQLTIEPGTAFASQTQAGRWRPADEEMCADHYELAETLTGAAGLRAYEVSNFAIVGEQSRHNLLYWRYGDYVGVGPGAHGRMTFNGERLAIETHQDPQRYLECALATGTGASLIEPLDDEAQLVERLTMGLRLAEGVAFGADDTLYKDKRRAVRLAQMIDDGVFRLDGGRLYATASGRRMLNRALYELLG